MTKCFMGSCKEPATHKILYHRGEPDEKWCWACKECAAACVYAGFGLFYGFSGLPVKLTKEERGRNNEQAEQG